MRTRTTWTRETCPVNSPTNLKHLTPRQRAQFARLGGLTAQRMGTAHRWTREDAQIVGRKGGLASGVTRGRNAAAAGSHARTTGNATAGRQQADDSTKA